MKKLREYTLIGVAGKAGAGKDLVGDVIRYVAYKHLDLELNKTLAFKDWQEIDRGLYSVETYKVKKFADTLKEMVCLLIGCDRLDLEHQDFKAKELGKEWDKWCVYSMGILVEVFTTEEEQLEEYPLSEDYAHQFEKMTPRKLLQLLGTECGRDIIHPNVWLNALFAKYKGVHYGEGLDPFGSVEDNAKKVSHVEYPSWLITDVRFPNEVQAIKDRGGVVLRVNRGCHDSTHKSETALDNVTLDVEIDNNGTIEELVKKIEELW